jgi:GNAT superfamily N-acetyltransferase
MQVEVIPVTAEDVLPLRRLVLRADTPDAPADFPEDNLPGTVHLAARRGDRAGGRAVVAVATLFPSGFEAWPAGEAWQLRGMAVSPDVQGQGVGAVVLAEGVRLVREAGGVVLWAKGRDSAVGFYERQGWEVVGDGYEYGPARLPHHTVMLVLDPSRAHFRVNS